MCVCVSLCYPCGDPRAAALGMCWELWDHGAPCQSQGSPSHAQLGVESQGKAQSAMQSLLSQLFQAGMHWAEHLASPLCGNLRKGNGIEPILHHFNAILPSGSWLLWDAMMWAEMEKLGCRKCRKSHFPPQLKAQQSRRFLPAPCPGAICSQVTLLLSHLSQALFLNQSGLFPSLIPAAKLLLSICISIPSVATLYHEFLPL